MKTPKTKAKSKIDTVVRTYFEGEQALCKKLGLTKRLVVLFPKRPYGRPSWFGALLLHLLRAAGGTLDIEYRLKDK